MSIQGSLMAITFGLWKVMRTNRKKGYASWRKNRKESHLGRVKIVFRRRMFPSKPRHRDMLFPARAVGAGVAAWAGTMGSRQPLDES